MRLRLIVAAEVRRETVEEGLDDYKVMAVHNFADWRLEVGGLVERPMTLALQDLRALRAKQTQRVLHNCIQGWTSIGEWSGLPMRDLVELVKPLPQARYVCFLTMQDTGRDDPSAEGQGQFYEVIDLTVARQSHTLLAYEMNGEPLPIKHALRCACGREPGRLQDGQVDRAHRVHLRLLGHRCRDGGMARGQRLLRQERGDLMGTEWAARPEITVLSAEQKHRVAKQLRRHRITCTSCGSEDLDIGDGLYLGFLFLHEEQDSYLIALTCKNPDCPAPRTGVRAHESQFLDNGEEPAGGPEPRRAGAPQ